MKNILTLENGLEVNLVDNGKILILSDSVKIILNKDGSLISTEILEGESESANFDSSSAAMLKEIRISKDKKVLISNLLHEMGIPANLLGYQYLKSAISLSYENEEYLNAFVKKLYPEIAKLHNSTPTRVERAIRHAVEMVWEKGNIKLLNEIFGSCFDNSKGKTKNSVFISVIVDRIKNS